MEAGLSSHCLLHTSQTMIRSDRHNPEPLNSTRGRAARRSKAAQGGQSFSDPEYFTDLHSPHRSTKVRLARFTFQHQPRAWAYHLKFPARKRSSFPDSFLCYFELPQFRTRVFVSAGYGRCSVTFYHGLRRSPMERLRPFTPSSTQLHH